MAVVNYKCPNCGAPLAFNPDKQLFSCEFCSSDFTEEKIRQIYAEREAAQSQAEKQEKKSKERAEKQASSDKAEEEQAVVYTCPSCGAQVVATASTAATICFYCQNPVVLGGRLSGEFKPDRIIPFVLSKEKAAEKFFETIKNKRFLPKDFSGKDMAEKMTGVYFPYWYVDTQRKGSLAARGEKVRTWRTGKNRYTETSIYDLYRDGDIIVKNVFERALKNEDREMLRCVHPYDLTKAKKFSMSFLSGFQAEKRDLEKQDLRDEVNKRIAEYDKKLLCGTINGYTAVQIKEYSEKTDLESWNYTLLPVWIVTYKYKDKILPFAINGQTGKIYGSLPVSNGRLALLAVIIAAAVFILGTIGGLLL